MKKNLLLALVAIAVSFQASATISQIRWGTTKDPLNGLTITWSNTGTKDSIKWGYTTSYEKGKFVSTSRTGYTSGTLFFKYTFPTVTGSSTIYYSLYDSKAKTWGSQMTFKTAPPASANSFSFCAMGDCRDIPSELTKVSNLGSAQNPSFCLFNGDLTVDGNSASEYNTFFTSAANYLQNNLNLQAEGNHDYADESMFSNLWDLPTTHSQNLYYAVTYANTIFITINANTFYSNGSDATQLAWLDSTLAAAQANKNITWKVISLHYAFFTDGEHNGDMDAFRSTIWAAFDKYGVDLVLNGHDHDYQRTYPVNLSVSSTAPVAKYGSGTGEGRMEITFGGAGADLYTKGSSNDAWALINFISTNGYNYITVNGCKMHVISYNDANSIIDSATLDKTGTSECNSPTGIETSAEPNNLITVYPNPGNGSFTLHYSSTVTGDAIIQIVDMTGKIISSEKINKAEQELNYHFDVSKYAAGIYNISVTVGGHRDSTPFELTK
ncbi:MAG TPA: T9SS type A sorting domain-containing protein [Bacteroidia bacterium]|jgi:hypothetical protein|nr:T9SS type A sorting domain-containing protein [Bacteroidia bacterium]